MLRINVSFSRKECPVEFASIQAGCSLERELADGTPPEAIRQAAAALYELAQASVNAQLAAAQSPQPTPPPEVSQAPAAGANRVARLPGGNGNGHGNGQPRRTYRKGQPAMASEAQKKAIASICRDRNLNVADVLADWNGDLEVLTIKEASQVIDFLKTQPANNNTRR